MLSAISTLSFALTGPRVPSNFDKIGKPNIEKAAKAETGKPGHMIIGVFFTIPSPVGEPGFMAIP
jgi:hypothetical protein